MNHMLLPSPLNLLLSYVLGPVPSKASRVRDCLQSRSWSLHIKADTIVVATLFAIVLPVDTGRVLKLS